MKKYLIIIVVLNMVLFTCCTQEKVSDLHLIKKSWTHSGEEENENGYSIYRPSDYKEFPPSRFRQTFDFKDNRVCIYLVLAPNDAHYNQEGVWEYDESIGIITVMNGTDVVFEFKVLELNKNILKLKRL
jgi:hypothetical protein